MKPSREEVLRVAKERNFKIEEFGLAMYEAGAAAERAVSDRLLEALKDAQLHHTTTSMPKAIERFGSPQAASEFGRKTWFGTVPNIIAEVEAMRAQQAAVRKENKE